MATNCNTEREETENTIFETNSNKSDQGEEQSIQSSEVCENPSSSTEATDEMKTTIGIYPFKNENFSSPGIGMNAHYYKDIGSLNETHLRDRIHLVNRDMESPNPSEDEIDVGCPSPIQKDLEAECDNRQLVRNQPEINRKEVRRRTYSSSSSTQGDNDDDDSHNGEDSTKHPNSYFKPLKKLKMMQIDKIKYSINRKETTNNNKKVFSKQRLDEDLERAPEENARRLSSSDDGDLRRHYEATRRHSIQSDDSSTNNNNNGVKSFSILDILSHKTNNPPGSQCKETKIVRPWDEETVCDRAGKELTPPPAHINFTNNYLLDRNLQFLENCRTLPFLDTRAALALPNVLHQQLLNRTLLQQNLVHQQLRSKSIDLTNNHSLYESERSSSEKSISTNNSNCTSPDIQPQSASSHPQTSSSSSHQQGGRKKNSPLDALFQMTNKTFDELNGENTGKSLNNFASLSLCMFVDPLLLSAYSEMPHNLTRNIPIILSLIVFLYPFWNYTHFPTHYLSLNSNIFVKYL